MIQVSVPATVPLKDYDYNAEVELINPVADTVANANYRGADVDWYVKADDIVLKNKGTHAEIHRTMLHSNRRRNKRC
jgi:Bacterial protein of unknown function (DUF961)